MNAVVQDSYGSADVLELRDIDRPVVGMTRCSYRCARPAWIPASGTS
jgi:hypothetical protein